MGFQSRNASSRFHNLPRDIKSHVHDWFVCTTLPNPAALRSFLSNRAHNRSPVVWTALRSFLSNRAHNRSPVVWTALRSFLSNRAHNRSPVVWTALRSFLSNRAHNRSPVVWTALRSFLSNRSPVVWTALKDRLSPVAPHQTAAEPPDRHSARFHFSQRVHLPYLHKVFHSSQSSLISD